MQQENSDQPIGKLKAKISFPDSGNRSSSHTQNGCVPWPPPGLLLPLPGCHHWARGICHTQIRNKKKKVTENLLFSLIPDGWIFLFSKTVLPKGTWGSCTRQGATACNKNSHLRNSCTFQYLDCIWHFFPEILMHVRFFSVFNSLCLEGQKGNKYT